MCRRELHLRLKVLQNWAGRPPSRLQENEKSNKKVIAKAMRTETETEMEELCEKPNKIFEFQKINEQQEKMLKGKMGRDGRTGLKTCHSIVVVPLKLNDLETLKI